MWSNRKVGNKKVLSAKRLHSFALALCSFIFTLCKYFFISLSHTTTKQPDREIALVLYRILGGRKGGTNNKSNCFIHDVPVSENEQKGNAKKHDLIKWEPKMKKSEV